MKKSFTLIELLVVIAIIGLLVIIIAIPINRVRRGASIARTLQYEASLHRYLGADIVGWWQFNEGEGSVAYDISGNDNHGTLVNNPQRVDGVPGKEGSALNFIGNNGWIEISDSQRLRGKQDISVSLWIYPVESCGNSANSWQTNQPVIHKQLSGTYGDWGLGLTSTCRLTWYAEDNGQDYQLKTPDNSIELDRWQNIVFSMDWKNSNLVLYINGEEKASDLNLRQTASASTDVNIVIGRFNYASNFFTGFMDDVRIYSRALTSEEINTLYTETKDKYIAEEL